jgi:4'-phosphopantetheinyl transferase
MTEEVQVWVGDLEVSDSRYAELSRSLSADERRRAEDLAPIAARRFVVGRGILRNLLAGFTGVPAPRLRFTYGTNGKPSLANHDISFNVSHSADLGVFAFAPDRPVGVDLENERPVRRLLDVAQRFLSEEELRSLAATPPAERDASFLRSWVVKEARLKAEGKGIWSASAIGGSPGNLTHKLFSPRPGFIAAVAAADSDWRLFTCTVKH